MSFIVGLHEWKVFEALYKLVEASLPDSPKLSKFSMLTMFLMKLRLNLFDEDISSRFSVHQSTVFRNFRVLNVMAVQTILLNGQADTSHVRRCRCHIRSSLRHELCIDS